MNLKQIILIFLTFLLTTKSAFAFVSCQPKYDSDKRSLPSLRGKCNICHISPNGSGPQNEFGQAFAKAGFKITDDLVTKFPNLFQKQEESPKPLPSPSPASEEALKPQIKRIKPNSFKVNVQSTASILGQNFASGTKAFIDNNEVLTTVKSNVLLIIKFVLSSGGSHEVKVKTPDGQESNTVKVRAK